MSESPPVRRERLDDVVAGAVVCALLLVGPLMDLPETGWTGRRDDALSLPIDPLVIDPNICPVGLLTSLPGVGPVLAERIDTARRAFPFRSADDLERAHGVGPATIAAVRSYLRFGPGRGD